MGTKKRFSTAFKRSIKVKANAITKKAGFKLIKVNFNQSSYSVTFMCKSAHRIKTRGLESIASKKCTECALEKKMKELEKKSNWKIKKQSSKLFILQCKTCLKKVKSVGRRLHLFASPCLQCHSTGGPLWFKTQKGVSFLRLVKEKNGKVLGRKTLRYGKKLASHPCIILECEQKHTWVTYGRGVLAGQWCNQCKRGLYERAMRVALNEFTSHCFMFVYARDVLEDLPIRTNRFQFDAFCQTLMINVEMDGIQHDKYDPYFHKDYASFLRIKQNDRLKNKLLKSYGITNIRVKEASVFKALRNGTLKDLVYSIIKKAKLLNHLPKDFDARVLNMTDVYGKGYVYADSRFKLCSEYISVNAARFPVDEIRKNRKTKPGTGYKIIQE